MKMITVKDCEDLREKFEKYCETAEQHQFPLLLMIDIMMQKTMKGIRRSRKPGRSERNVPGCADDHWRRFQRIPGGKPWK